MLHSSVRLIESLSVAAAVFLATAAVLGVSFVLALSYDVPISALLRDPAVTTSESGFYVGSLSNLGALLWASAAVCLTFAYMVLRTVAGDRKMKNFLLASAVLTAMLSLDDFFLLHEEVYPLIGIPEKVVYGIYLIVGVVYLARFRKTI
ncbi:MAG TPA: hypothetical protein VGW38_16540, partial [Chloroflexota bacterium]|nr:hypothetical protein [Chloroflexota bacterium]